MNKNQEKENQDQSLPVITVTHYKQKNQVQYLDIGGKQAKAWKKGSFYEHKLLYYISSLQLQGTYIDVGANIGNHTIYFAAFCPSDFVFSFEPLPKQYNLLQSNINLNEKFKNKIFTFNCGCSQSNNQVENTVGKEKYTFQTQTIDSIIFNSDYNYLASKVSLIKIDVEGMEKAVLAGATKTLQRYAPLLFIEARTNKDFEEIEGFLQDFNYRPTGKVFNATPTYEFKHVTIADFDIFDKVSFFRKPKPMKRKISLEEYNRELKASRNILDQYKKELRELSSLPTGKQIINYRKKFKAYFPICLISIHRTGSTYMLDLLNGHNQIVAHGEIFNPYQVYIRDFQKFLPKLSNHYNLNIKRRGSHHLINLIHRDPINFINFLSDVDANKQIIFKLSHDHLKWKQVMESIVHNVNIYKVFLLRNPIDAYISLKKARNLNKFKMEDTTDFKISLDVQDFLNFYTNRKLWFQQIEKELLKSHQNYIIFQYEDLISIQKSEGDRGVLSYILNRMQNIFGIDFQEPQKNVHTNLVKQDRSKIRSEKVNNYEDFMEKVSKNIDIESIDFL